MHHASPFRTATLHCPRCPAIALTDGELRHCTRCEGAWIPEETLAEHVSTMQVEMKPTLQWAASTRRIGLPCAACKHTMETLLLFGVPVDRCHSHGVWFDKDEMPEMLRRSAAYVKPAPATTAIAAPVEVGALALDVGAAAVEVALEAASAGIFEGVLEVIGGIFSALDF